MGAALVMAACGSDDDGGSADTTAAGGAETTAAAGGETTAAAGGETTAAAGGDCVVGVSWNNYQEERWAKFDEPAIKAAVEAGGGTTLERRQSSAETQASNIENLISQGANVLIVLAQDGTAVKPSVASAISNGIPVIGYDRLIEDETRSTSRSTTSRSDGCRPRPSSTWSRAATTSSSRATRPMPTLTSSVPVTRRSSVRP